MSISNHHLSPILICLSLLFHVLKNTTTNNARLLKLPGTTSTKSKRLEDMISRKRALAASASEDRHTHKRIRRTTTTSDDDDNDDDDKNNEDSDFGGVQQDEDKAYRDDDEEDDEEEESWMYKANTRAVCSGGQGSRSDAIGSGSGSGSGSIESSSSWTDVPCGRCPVYSFCTQGGPVNPVNCVYLNRWLSF